MVVSKVSAYRRTHPLFDESLQIFVPSGFKGAWLVVEEDNAYNLHVRYADETETKMMEGQSG